jgi:hypothetical protein
MPRAREGVWSESIDELTHGRAAAVSLELDQDPKNAIELDADLGARGAIGGPGITAVVREHIPARAEEFRNMPVPLDC